MRTTLALVFVLALSTLGFAGALNNPGSYPVIFNPGRAAAINSSIRTPIISWSAPTTRTDSTSLSSNEIQGYRVFYGTETRSYTGYIDVGNINDTAMNILYLPANTYYMSISIKDTDNQFSGFGNEIVVTVTP